MGRNYLDALSNAAALGDRLANVALSGIVEVLAGNRSVFRHEYPCHSGDEKRWFTMRIASLHGDEPSGMFIISHHNITQRKLAEERVEELAMKDPLTGLCNRRAYTLFLREEIRRSMRTRTPIGLALVDVDNFKSYNDEFGHAAGDKLLSIVGQTLLGRARRPGDLVARLGGDEFALIQSLSETGTRAVWSIAEAILKEVRDLNLFCDESRQVTVSIGFVSVVPHEQHTDDLIFEEADKALYRAKSAGRNQAVCVLLGPDGVLGPDGGI